MPEPLLPLDPDGQDFAELMAVESIDESTFRSIAKPCVNVPKPINGKMHFTTFGGHIYAQSAWAAAQTVGEGFVIHNTSGYFVSPGFNAFPFVYTIHRIRDGRAFATRSVTVTQPSLSPSSPNSPSNPSPDDTTSIVFTALISFKVPESNHHHQQPDHQATSPNHHHQQRQPQLLSYQDTSHPPPLTTFAAALHATHPRDLPVKKYADLVDVILDASPYPHRSPSMSGISWAQLPGQGNTHEPATREQQDWWCDPRPAARRSGNVYTVTGNVLGGGGSRSRMVNLSVCVHLFASDRETLFLVARHLGVRELLLTPAATVTSLSHVVVLHEVGDAVVFPDSVVDGDDGRRREEREKERWFCQEVFTDRWADGRVVVHGRVYDVDTGVHVATTMQEGVLKPVLQGDEVGVERLREALLTGALPRGLRSAAKM